MSNSTVTACSGWLLDSDNGAIFGNYEHNENYVFTICVPDSATISLKFSSFCTEEEYDSLRIFDGPDTLSPQLGPAYHGLDGPGTVYSSSNYLTIHFRSDPSITCYGWQARWSTLLNEAPTLANVSIPNPNPDCGSQEIELIFDQRMPCDSLGPDFFRINGPLMPIVSNTTLLDCVNDSATTVRLHLASGLDESGFYEVAYQSQFIDLCDSVWNLSAQDTLLVQNCPIQLSLGAEGDTICEGECILLRAQASQGDLFYYHYAWSHTNLDQANVNACPNQSQTFYLTVSDEHHSPVAKDSITIFVRPKPTLSNDTVLCQSADSIQLQASPEAGWWYGDGIIDESEGWFHPDTAGAGFHILHYTDPNDCQNHVTVQVKGIDGGPPESACPGSPTFQLENFEPPGGYWTGIFVTDSIGIFNPLVSGDYRIQYHVNGCTDDKEIQVKNIQIPTQVDTVCESTPIFEIEFSPPGGRWHGNGIIDSLNGIFAPPLARSGTHILYYSVNGCTDSMQLFVRALSIGQNILLCPDAGITWLGDANPDGGVWSGLGVVDSINGLYDPSIPGVDFNDVVTYTWGGCYKSRNIYIRETVVDIDTVWLCLSDGEILLDWDQTRRRPYNGSWSGNGVTDPDFPGLFDPLLAGAGDHTLYYEANGCTDSIVFRVRPNAIETDTAVCEYAEPFAMRSSQPGGIWSGPGIVDSVLGLFDARAVGLGTWYIHYDSPHACKDSMAVEVYPLQYAEIMDLSSVYCFRDTLYSLRGDPSGGIFYGAGIQDSLFNPANAGEGQHLIEYIKGTGGCARRAEGLTAVSAPLSIEPALYVDTLCSEEEAELEVLATGGNGSAIHYEWSHKDHRERFEILDPQKDSSFYAIAYEGCSDPDTAFFRLFVKKPFEISFDLSDIVCAGEMGYAIAHVSPPTLYGYHWKTNPPQFNDTLIAPAFYRYELCVEDLLQGCKDSVITEIPAYDLVQAFFLPNPNEECTTTEDPTFMMLDLSTGGLSGTWDFGDGHQQSYIPNQNPVHRYETFGEYTVSLFLENGAGCQDYYETEVCVLPAKPRIMIPNAFSPNGDQNNDRFEIQGVGILDYHIQIFNRWGKMVFQSYNPAESWDGTVHGLPAPEGSYVYFIRGHYQSDNPRIDYGPTLLQERGSILLIR